MDRRGITIDPSLIPNEPANRCPECNKSKHSQCRRKKCFCKCRSGKSVPVRQEPDRPAYSAESERQFKNLTDVIDTYYASKKEGGVNKGK